MSSHLVLAAVSSGVRRLLRNSISADATVRPLVGTEEAIVFLNPTETARDSGNRLSLWLWLYQIAENELTRNAPTVRAADDAKPSSCSRPSRYRSVSSGRNYSPSTAVNVTFWLIAVTSRELQGYARRAKAMTAMD
ncbi:Pvc16 family protein [Actinomycetospora cinnamomea]|uniref:Uncharacterized protein DUF4255 n=1 Tax=Actinomycetospora cinnamomea TaxID=663609 RepID=A0A2U1F7M1_9PSEU|nr:Pvc16 family protein [Actinomycetospora cinnamomea]PVZ08187.1 uncharacterized protein DUF4255 [Actinomycetospora cinnamomea]